MWSRSRCAYPFGAHVAMRCEPAKWEPSTNFARIHECATRVRAFVVIFVDGIPDLLRDQFRMRALLDGQAVMDGHDPVGMRVTLIPSRRVQGDRLL
jgi:hypothetical protein